MLLLNSLALATVCVAVMLFYTWVLVPWSYAVGWFIIGLEVVIFSLVGAMLVVAH